MSFYFYRHQRERLLKGILYLSFLILFIRFFQLQVLSGSVYKEWSDRNRVRQISVIANRGLIFDRTNRILVDNRPSYSLFNIPYEFEKNPEMVERISSITGLSGDEIKNRILQVENGLFIPVRIVRDMDFETLSKVEEYRLDLPGVFYQYEGYREEKGIAPDSTTETYAELELFINNFRWTGMPVHIRTGKAVGRRGTEIG
ncbi:hypothetical protein MUP95_04250, partial [bacterium]|nr:hypothetical protein [bacterium]